MIHVKVKRAVATKCFSPDDKNESYITVMDVDTKDLLHLTVPGSHNLDTIPALFVLDGVFGSTAKDGGKMRLQAGSDFKFAPVA